MMPISLKQLLGSLLLLLPMSFLATVQAETTRVNSIEVKALLDQGVALVDIRRKDEWKRTGVITDSKLLTFFDRKGNHDIELWLQELAKIIDINKPIIIVCETGYRSTLLSKLLAERPEIPNLYNASSGLYGWKHKHGTLTPYPIE